MEIFLTAPELEQLTDYKYPARQRTWLIANGIPHLVGASGQPKVLRTVLDKMLGGSVESQSFEPDFSNING